MRRTRRRIVSFALVAGVVAAPAALVSAGGASAAAWLPAQELPTIPHGIAIDADGDAVVVGRGADNVVRATERRFGTVGWSAPAVLAADADPMATPPQVTVDGDGNAVAIWTAREAGTRLIRIASRPAGGTWSAPATLSDDEVPWSDAYSLATDRQGTTTVAWAERENGSGSNYILRALSRATRGSWPGSTTKVNLTTSSDDIRSPVVAVGDHDVATVAWVGVETAPGGSGVDSVIRSSSRDVSWGAWSAAHKLSGAAVGTPKVVSDPAGNATVIWTQNGNVRVSHRPAGGSWTSAPGTDLGAGTEPQLAAASDGTRTAVWVAPDGSGSAIRTRTSADRGTTWGTADDLAESDSAFALKYPQVSSDAQGGMTAIWGRIDGSQLTAEVARRPAGGTWNHGPDLGVGTLSTYPIGAIDRKGHVTLAWTGPAALPGASSILDAVAPELRNPVVPTTGVVGQPVTVSVEPFDLTAVTTTWSFGGAAASGTTASHTFATPGDFTITVTAQDAAGNTAETSSQITIHPADVKGPPHRPDPEPKSDPLPDPTPAARAPVLSGLQQTSSRWTLRKRRGSRVPVGTSFRYRLDRAAKVRLEFGQIVTGRRSGKRCVKATTKNRTRRACERVESRGTLSAFGKAGANGVEFRGKVGKRTLKPGRYRVRVTATARDDEDLHDRAVNEHAPRT